MAKSIDSIKRSAVRCGRTLGIRYEDPASGERFIDEDLLVLMFKIRAEVPDVFDFLSNKMP